MNGRTLAFFPLLVGCDLYENQLQPRGYLCPDGTTEVSSSDASALGFSAEDVWAFLEANTYALSLQLSNGASPASRPGVVTFVRTEGTVVVAEDWSSTASPCRGPKLRVPVTMSLTTDDGSIRAEGPIHLDVEGLDLAEIWFEDEHLDDLPVEATAELDAEWLGAEPVLRYSFLAWTGLSSSTGGVIVGVYDEAGEEREDGIWYFDWSLSPV